MPKVNEPVRVFFPSENLDEAFAASSVNVREMGSDNKEKVFTSPEGMTVKFYEGGIFIACKEKKVFIDLQKDGKILIDSNKNISVVANANINLESGSKIDVKSDKDIFIGTKQSFIELSSKEGGKIDIYSQKVFVE